MTAAKKFMMEELPVNMQELELKLEMLEKGGYEHFMLKEIYEQPRSVRDCLRGRIYPNEGRVQLGGISEYAHKLKNIDRIIIVACGRSVFTCRTETSSHSGRCASASDAASRKTVNFTTLFYHRREQIDPTPV